MRINTGCFLDGCKCFDPEDEDGVGIKADREWQGLTDEEEILELSKDAWGRDKLSQGRKDHTGFYIAFGRAIEAKLKEKNHDK